MRVREVDLYAVYRFGLIFALCLEDELFENIVVPCDNTGQEGKVLAKSKYDVRERETMREVKPIEMSVRRRSNGFDRTAE